MYEFRSETYIRRPLEEVFAFFGDAGNLETLTPGFLRFRILTPTPIKMEPGTLIDYKLKIRGFSVRWRSEITVWVSSAPKLQGALTFLAATRGSTPGY